MSRAPQVNDLITRKWPHSFCDACLAKALGLRFNSSAPSQLAVALATTSDFDRTNGQCSTCRDTREVTRRITDPSDAGR